MRLTAAALAVCLILAGCGEKDQPQSPPEPEAPDITQTAIADAPPGIRAVEIRRVLRGGRCERSGSAQAEIPACIKRSLAQGTPAWGTITQNTVEGNPIPTTYVARSERDILVFTDATKDEFGAHIWLAESCRDWTTAVSSLARAAVPPKWTRRRPPNSSSARRFQIADGLGSTCRVSDVGRLGSTRPASNASTARCRGGGRLSSSPEARQRKARSRTTSRARENGIIERFADATQGGAGPRAWYYEECNRLGMYVTLRGCTNRTELPVQ